MLRAEYDGRTVVSTDLTDEEWAEIGKAAQHKADARLLSPITCVLRGSPVFQGRDESLTLLRA